MLGMDQTGHVQGLPQLRQDKTLDIDSWLIANGLPPSSFVNLGLMPNYLMPLVYREADAALFPNRCEGGTNLVAMECLACGVPTILSANTGHLDLIDEKHCYPLVCQRPVPSHPIFPGTKGWGESDVDEIVEVLERIYHDRQSARQKGLLGAEFMIDLAWEKQIDRLVATIAHLL
jgi:Glycosyltransferase